MNSIDKLAELFLKFPGIGRRQSKRFVYFLLRQNGSYINELISEIQTLKQHISQCTSCYRFYAQNNNSECGICQASAGSPQIMIIEKDADLETVLRTNIYDGKFFVLGGLINANEKRPSFARIEELEQRLTNEQNIISEVIFGLSLSSEAEHTRIMLQNKLQSQFPDIAFSTLGRGLSTGTELEYSDSATLKYALESRIKQ